MPAGPLPYPYYVIVIHAWGQAGDGAEVQWRYTLGSSATDQRRGFTDRQALLNELEKILADMPGPAPLPSQPPPPAS